MPRVAALALLAVLAVACADSNDAPAQPASSRPTPSQPEPTRPEATAPVDTETDCAVAPEVCTLRELADAAGLTFGTAVQPGLLETDQAYAEAVRANFNSVTPENELKWFMVQPEPGAFDFAPADAVIGWAEAEGLEVKGHTLVWEQDLLDGQPPWVLAIEDPDELWAVLDHHLTAVLMHTAGRVDRWDIVNEPLETLGAEIHVNHYHRVLGPDYIARALRRAHEIDPDISLWINDNAVEYLPEKADALVALAESLVADGAPLDGVGLQMHLLAGTPQPGVVRDVVTRLHALGLEVSLTELDAPAQPGPVGATQQADTYRQVITEFLAAGGREITVWGVDDGHAWLDGDPMLFTADYEPKDAYDAVRDVITDHLLSDPTS